MNTLNAVIGVGYMVGALVFCVLSCDLLDNDNFYTERTKVVLARTIVVVGVATIIGFGYTMIKMQLDAVDQNQFIPNMVGSVFPTLVLGGIGWFLLSLNEIPIILNSKKGGRCA